MHSQLVPNLAPLPRATGRSRPTGLVPGTLVATEDGDMPVEFLLAGDRIVTANGLVELRGMSSLQALEAEMVVIDAAAPVGEAPRNGAPVVVPAHQQVLVRDWRAMILHGQAQMLTRAASLVDDVLVRRETRATQRLIRLHFDTPQVVRAGGLDLACARGHAPRMTVPGKAARALH